MALGIRIKRIAFEKKMRYTLPCEQPDPAGRLFFCLQKPESLGFPLTHAVARRNGLAADVCWFLRKQVKI
jgi:hypothetical protein